MKDGGAHSGLPGVVWVTGLSGSGKSTLVRHVQRLLRRQGVVSVILDGDEVRAAVGDALCGHDPASRLENAYRISRLARTIAGQGVPVLVATMSLFHEVHEWNRANLPGYLEVLLEADLATVMERDPKGLYSRGRAGQEDNVVGLDMPPQMPLAPHVRFDNDRHLDDPALAAEELLERIREAWRASAGTGGKGDGR